MKNKILIVGMGYVGLANALMLSQKNDVIIFDIDKMKVYNFNRGVLPLGEDMYETFYNKYRDNIIAISDESQALSNKYDFIIIALPTDYDQDKKAFNTTSIEDLIVKIIDHNIDTCIVFKSTLPIGFTRLIKEKFQYDQILVSPEFLRENKALSDCLNPSRIVVGGNKIYAMKYVKMLKNVSKIEKEKVFIMNETESEAVKLFSNAYLATRVCFFNELDNFSLIHNLDAKTIISGVCSDPRIGDHYNNPSFGFGGYCLPKDTKQLANNYPYADNLFSAVLNNNNKRAEIIAQILNRDDTIKTIGIYKLAMKKSSYNCRNSAIFNIISKLQNKNLIVYEPLDKTNFNNLKRIDDLSVFKQMSDLILCNRYDALLEDVKYKVFTRDVFNEN